ncbi:spore germination protein [Scopulibacillus darangshiensis]|uniref:Spore germination protein n=1 Tax=Scopulibacillus darangshiensis TaxID=442528 RepID=A0A4R2P9R0_9BACL|nr:glycosyl hydrolase family 18 protein [Scopulibacillus darangshiensis]TCP31773.1 spore germination protein [Scopulibacillus darangshiensis]
MPMFIHVVRSGETLWQIASRYGVSLSEIEEVNQLPNPDQLVIGQAIVIPSGAEGNKPTIDVNAYIFNLERQSGQTVARVADDLTYLMPFAYRIQADGGLTPINDNAAILAAYQHRVVPIMAITNFTSTETGTTLAHTILSSPQLQNTLLTNILGMMRAKGYQGLNIDFENVNPDDRESYNQFLQRTVNLLHPEGYSVSTALAPKTSAEQAGLLYEAHDYPAHGRIADFVILMTYEWGYRLGPPQAVSPINQIKRVLDYAVTVIPRDKIFMGFQLYARDWLLPHVQGQEAETFSQQEAIRRAVKYKAAIQYDKETESPFFRYTDEQGRRHEVWFEDARSAQAKFDLVKNYRLRGISYWALGFPFPQNWALLEANFNIRKMM